MKVLVSEPTSLTITLMKRDKRGMVKVPEARENMMLGSWKESRMCRAKRTKTRVARVGVSEKGARSRKFSSKNHALANSESHP